MKGVSSICMGDGTDHGKTADSVKQIVAHHQGRTTPFLLMACLRVKIQIYDISLFKNSYHTSLPSALPQSSSSL